MEDKDITTILYQDRDWLFISVSEGAETEGLCSALDTTHHKNSVSNTGHLETKQESKYSLSALKIGPYKRLGQTF